MAILLILAVICAGASFSFYTANDAAGNVPDWASKMCSASHELCHRPQELAYTAVAFAALWIVIKFMSLMRD
jgi:hypothetical protein